MGEKVSGGSSLRDGQPLQGAGKKSCGPSHILRWQHREWALGRVEASTFDQATGGWTRVGLGVLGDRGRQRAGVLVSDWAGPGRSLGAGGPGDAEGQRPVRSQHLGGYVSVGLCEEWHVAAVGTLESIVCVTETVFCAWKQCETFLQGVCGVLLWKMWPPVHTLGSAKPCCSLVFCHGHPMPTRSKLSGQVFHVLCDLLLCGWSGADRGAGMQRINTAPSTR